MNFEKRMILDNLWRAAEMDTAMILPIGDDDWTFWWLLKDLSTILLYGKDSEQSNIIKEMVRHQLKYLIQNE